MAVDRLTGGHDAGAENAENAEPRPPGDRRRPPPPDRPGAEGFPSRADSRHGAVAANTTDRQSADVKPTTTPSPETSDAAIEPRRDDHKGSLDRSLGRDEEAPADSPEFTPEQLAELREAEDAIRGLAERHGVRIDYTTHPIDPANARDLNKAITRMADEHPGVFRHVHAIKTLDSNGMAESGSDGSALAHAIHEGQRPTGGEPIDPGIYFNQIHFSDKTDTDRRATNDRARGWNVGGTAEGTLYHEFGHVIENQLRKSPEVKNDLARELKDAGISVDPDSLAIAYPPGPQVIVDGLSRYGATRNGREMIAEGFCEWKLTEHPRPIARAIGTVIDRHFKET